MLERIGFKILDWLFLDTFNRAWERQVAKHRREMDEMRQQYLRRP